MDPLMLPVGGSWLHIHWHRSGVCEGDAGYRNYSISAKRRIHLACIFSLTLAVESHGSISMPIVMHGGGSRKKHQLLEEIER